jgi:hypothetical protein
MAAGWRSILFAAEQFARVGGCAHGSISSRASNFEIGAGQKFFVFAEPFGPFALLCPGLPEAFFRDGVP